MNQKLNRRHFLIAGGAAASVAILKPSLFSGGTALAAPVVRRDVGGLTATDPILVSYAKAIKAMKMRPATDPLSWDYQAAIHGTLMSGSHPAWNTCEHGTYFFWPWHRMYLYWFEKIIRKMSGDYGWALPYWNYESASERHLPAPFRDPSSELYTTHRGSGWNSGANSLSASTVDTSAGMAWTTFADASSSLEGTPHGAVHVSIGGWMGSVPTAAQDPIFYLHHANIDRLWNLWLAQGGGRTDPLSDSTWRTTSFTFFDQTGTQVHNNSCDVLRCAEQLNYTYEGEPTEIKEYCLRILPWWILQIIELIRWPIPPELIGERVQAVIDTKQVSQRIATVASSRNETLLLELDVEAERGPDVVWEVYLGLPPNAQPDSKSPFYVGNIALFGRGVKSEAHGGHMPAHFRFKLNRAVQAHLRANTARVAADEGRVPVTFVPIGPEVDGKQTRPKGEVPLRITQAALSIATQVQNKG
jgi:tyrosinase